MVQARNTISVHAVADGDNSFETTRLEASKSRRLVLFSAGAGGNPHRHLPLLKALADDGCTVVAPHFERLVSSAPTLEDLLLRSRRLCLALNSAGHEALPVTGVGHSIGATLLLALAGAQAWTLAREQVRITCDTRFEQLLLFAPATDFFRAPGALDAVRTPIVAWTASNDTVTPPAQAAFLKEVLAGRATVQLRMVQGGGHFSFMHELPPHVTDLMPERDAFLTALAAEVCGAVNANGG